MERKREEGEKERSNMGCTEFKYEGDWEREEKGKEAA